MGMLKVGGGCASLKLVERMVGGGLVPPIGWFDCLGSALFAGAFLLHDSSCCLAWTGATGVGTAAVSGASPRYTRPIPRTRRRIGSSPLASAKKISPERVPR